MIFAWHFETQTHLVRSILTSFVFLPFLICLVKIRSWMFLLPIIHKMHRMSVHHLIAERKNVPFWIHLICHLFFPKIPRVKIYVSHQPLCMIRQILRMLMYIFNFLIVDVVISLLIHSIMIMIHLLLIFLSHQSLMIYKLMKWKPHK